MYLYLAVQNLNLTVYLFYCLCSGSNDGLINAIWACDKNQYTHSGHTKTEW